MSFADAIATLENHGEVNVKLSLHHTDKPEASSSIHFRAEKKVCFILDPVKEKKKPKAMWTKLIGQYFAFSSFAFKNGNMMQVAGNVATFGSKMSLAKIRACQNMKIIWRLRPGLAFLLVNIPYYVVIF